ncbi:MAG: hypothetical protein NVSMB27_16940 [Ktedonobacteraceae bacterium]
MQTQSTLRIRLGALALFISALLIVVATLLRGPFVDPAADQAGFVHWVTTPSFFPAAVLFLVSLILGIFGMMGLYGYLASRSAARLALIGMVLTIVTYAVLLAIVGTFAFIFPVVGKLYIQGQKSVIDVAVTFGSSFLVVLLMQAVLYSVAAIVMGMAVWRSGTLPKWSAITYIISGLILAFAPPLPFLPEIIGAVLLAMSVGGISWSIWQQTSVRPTSPETALSTSVRTADS